jgi:hypothetical protein
MRRAKLSAQEFDWEMMKTRALHRRVGLVPATRGESLLLIL